MRLKESLKKYSYLITISIFILFCLIIYLNGRNNENDFRNRILKKPIFTNGEVIKVQYINKRGFEVSFIYDYKNQKNLGIVNSDKYRGIKDVIIGKIFPVILNKENSHLVDILIFPEDFDSYKLEYPDSLHWTKQYSK